MPRKKKKKKCPGCEKNRKHLAYGQKKSKGMIWCSYCDAGHEDDINKKAERQKTKKEINREVVELCVIQKNL